MFLDLERDLHDVYAELLSAQCATDRLRRNHCKESIAKAERGKLISVLIIARELCHFYSDVRKQMGN